MEIIKQLKETYRDYIKEYEEDLELEILSETSKYNSNHHPEILYTRETRGDTGLEFSEILILKRLYEDEEMLWEAYEFLQKELEKDPRIKSTNFIKVIFDKYDTILFKLTAQTEEEEFNMSEFKKILKR